MRGFFIALCFGLSALFSNPLYAADPVGVVLLHGKWGSPGRHIDSLADSFRAAGYVVVTPEMPWSGARNYDKSFDDAMSEIDQAVSLAKAKGASRILVGGHSLGTNAALAYGATHGGLLGVMAIAPGHTPELPQIKARTASAVAQAQQLVADGHGVDSFGYRLPPNYQGVALKPTRASGPGPHSLFN